MRTKTPSHIKWLLNERAALLGDLKETQQQITYVEGELGHIQRNLQSQLDQAGHIASRIEALDSTLRQIDANVNPSAGGVVHAWAGRYGKRGGLTAFVIASLKAASEPLSTTTLATMAAAHFHLAFALPKHRTKIGKRVREICAGLSQSGQVQQFKCAAQRSVSHWSWQQTVPSLSDLAAMQATLGVPEA